jgi:demethylmenaquinone methyltransferase/2-methoxy-6-polyprenyl-1,4-benzoquinol methylase
MTAGQDIRWRREVIQRARLPESGCILDLGTGTGDLALEALRQSPRGLPVGADFTLEMMQVGKSRPGAGRISWIAADALALPFPTRTFDAVVSGFLLRNVTDLGRALAEQCRVLKPGGWLVSLDTTRPPRNLLTPAVKFHLHWVIPTLGRLVTGQAEAYTYLPDSTEGFLGAEQLAARLVTTGFREVGFRRLMLGTIAIHWGKK